MNVFWECLQLRSEKVYLHVYCYNVVIFTTKAYKKFYWLFFLVSSWRSKNGFSSYYQNSEPKMPTILSKQFSPKNIIYIEEILALLISLCREVPTDHFICMLHEDQINGFWVMTKTVSIKHNSHFFEINSQMKNSKNKLSLLALSRLPHYWLYISFLSF